MFLSWFLCSSKKGLPFYEWPFKFAGHNAELPKAPLFPYCTKYFYKCLLVHQDYIWQIWDSYLCFLLGCNSPMNPIFPLFFSILESWTDFNRGIWGLKLTLYFHNCTVFFTFYIWPWLTVTLIFLILYVNVSVGFHWSATVLL